jgi:hypothetical protein
MGIDISTLCNDLSTLDIQTIFAVSTYIDSVLHPDLSAVNGEITSFDSDRIEAKNKIKEDGQNLFEAYLEARYQANIDSMDALPSAYVDEYMAGNG